MPQHCSVVALAVSPGEHATQAVVDAVRGAGIPVESPSWVRVTGTASDDRAADVEGYNALTIPVDEEDMGARTVSDLRAVLRPDPQEQLVPGVDLNVVDARWMRNEQRKLVVLDVDSTLIRQEVIELLAAHAGREADVAAVTERAMRGEIDFTRSLHERVAALQGLPVEVLHEVTAAVRFSHGAKTLVRTLLREGHAVAAVSGGFSQVLEPLAASLELTRAAANQLEVRDGVLTGRVTGPVVDRAAKAEITAGWASELGVPPENVLVVGDGANDIDMARRAGLSVAYRAKPALREVADTQVTIPNLDAVRFFLDL